MNKTKIELTKTALISLILIVMVISAGSSYYLTKQSAEAEIERSQEFMDSYLLAQATLQLAGTLSAEGDDYYDLASYYYDYGYYQEVIDNSVMARSYYTSSSQEYKTAKALFEQTDKIAPNDYHELIINYVGLCDAASNIDSCMYEACEYFESASHKYDQYYETGDEGYYNIGNAELEKMNEKIRKHDEWVDVYNTYFANIDALLITRH